MESLTDAEILCISEASSSSFHVRELTRRKICGRSEVSASTKVGFVPGEAEGGSVELVPRE
jgi:hypothetical protein